MDIISPKREEAATLRDTINKLYDTEDRKTKKRGAKRISKKTRTYRRKKK